MSLASTVFASKLDIWAGGWSGSFNLVVGDGFADRVLFWNARLLIPAWLDIDPAASALDPTSLESRNFWRCLAICLNTAITATEELAVSRN